MTAEWRWYKHMAEGRKTRRVKVEGWFQFKVILLKTSEWQKSTGRKITDVDFDDANVGTY